MAATQGKYLKVAERLSHRIASGDYHLHGVPGERELASQVGVSYVTVRKAVQKLLDAGLLYRLPNGRLAVNGASEGGTGQKQVAMLAPAWESNEANLWNISLAQLRTRFDFGSRMIHYVHADDPAILHTIQQFDATFMLAPDTLSSDIVASMTNPARPVVVLNRDWSGMGVRSLRLFPPRMIQKLLDHLASLGHRRIDCFNVQPRGLVIEEWINQWQIWRAAHALKGELIDEPVMPFTDTLDAAYDVIARRIKGGTLRGTAILCLTETAAIGAMRAMLDHGIAPGKDVALCAVGSKRCEYLPLTLTTLEEPDPKPYLAACLEWALGSNRTAWQGPLLVEPTNLQVVVRQSTVPEIDKKQQPPRVRRSAAVSPTGSDVRQDGEG